jgi:hypothetical protein
MEQTLTIFTVLSAGAHCLLACPGIFSGLSNDGKQGAALILFSWISRETSYHPAVFLKRRGGDAVYGLRSFSLSNSVSPDFSLNQPTAAA